MILGFSGTRNGLTQPQRDALRSLLLEFKPAVVHHGCCVGADYEFALLTGTTADVEVHAHPSRLKSMTDRDAKDWSDVVHEPLPPLERNRVIVEASELLIACPAETTEQLRSGTWSTIRYARKRGIPIRIIYPDGAVETVGGRS